MLTTLRYQNSKRRFFQDRVRRGKSRTNYGLLCVSHAGMSCVDEGENRRTGRQPLCHIWIDWNSTRDFSCRSMLAIWNLQKVNILYKRTKIKIKKKPWKNWNMFRNEARVQNALRWGTLKMMISAFFHCPSHGTISEGSIVIVRRKTHNRA